MTIIETADVLYDLLESKDTFHLRGAGKGRDDALYDDLKARLACPTGMGLRTWLRNSRTPAEEFLAAFFAAAQPLGEMYRDIYAGMRTARVNGSSGIARIAFTDAANTLDLDLKHFEKWVRYLATAFARRPVMSWDEPSISALMDVGYHLVGFADYTAQAYSPGGELTLNPLPGAPSDSEVAFALEEGHAVLAGVIDAARWSGKAPSDYVLRPSTVGAFNEVSRCLSEPSPVWRQRSPALELLSRLPRERRSAEEERESPVEVFRKVLDLPVWQYRWYLYEIWTAFRLIGALSAFKPIVHVDDQGRLALTRGKPTTFASFVDSFGRRCVVAAQRETPVALAGRRGIAPDYRIVAEASDTTLAIVECKQWSVIFGTNLEQTMELYQAGCADSKINVFVNYDAPSGAKTAPLGTLLIEQFRPGMPVAVSQFEEAISDGLRRAGVAPEAFVVLLDVSTSMEGKYVPASYAAFHKWYLTHARPPMHTFNDQLGPVLPLTALGQDWSSLVCSGGTELEKAVGRTRELHGGDARILAITDVTLCEDERVTLWMPSSKGPSVD